MSAYEDRVASLTARLANPRARHEFPQWLRDQSDAAIAETGTTMELVAAVLPLLAPEKHFRGYGSTLTIDQRARWLAAIAGVTSLCSHIRKSHGAVPCIVNLNLRRADCPLCVQTVRRPIDDDRCEICDTPCQSRWTESLVQLGPMMVHANVGDCCSGVLVPVECRQ